MKPESAFLGVVHWSADGELTESFPSRFRPQRLRGETWTLTWSAFGPEASVFCQADSGIAFLGEVYDTPSLCSLLKIPAESSAAELLFVAFRRWPKRFLHHLDLLGVLAVWADRELHLYQCGSPARNIYYAERPEGGIAFASCLDLMFELPGLERRIHRPSVHEYLRFLDIAAPNTLYEGVQAIPAGYRLTVKANEILSDPVAPVDQVVLQTPSFKEAVDRAQELLEQSVVRRLGDLDRAAVFLSGGVDSSLVCALAKRRRPDTTAVTVGFAGERFDEAPVAQAIAGHLGVTHEVLRFDRAQYAQAFEALSQEAEQPFADPAAAATLLSLEYCRERFDGALDSSGADEAVGVMPPRHVRVAVQYAGRLPPPIRRLAVRAMRRLPWVRSYTPIFDFEHPAELMIRWHGFTRAEIEDLCGEPVNLEQTAFFQTFARFPRAAHFERFSALEDAMCNDRLHQARGITGLPLRFPYVEDQIDRFLRSLPIDYRYQSHAPKRILRELLARHVPRALWDAPKHGFDFPLLEFLRDEDFALVRRDLNPDLWQPWGLLAPDKVANYGQRFIAGEERLMFRVWTLMVLAAWLRGHRAEEWSS